MFLYDNRRITEAGFEVLKSWRKTVVEEVEAFRELREALRKAHLEDVAGVVLGKDPC